MDSQSYGGNQSIQQISIFHLFSPGVSTKTLMLQKVPSSPLHAMYVLKYEKAAGLVPELPTLPLYGLPLHNLFHPLTI